MHIKPILAALKRHKAGTILIAMQIALTLAIVCNAVFIIHQRLDRVQRPTGMIETDVMAIHSTFVGVVDNNAGPLLQADLQVLRQLPGVQDAVSINSYPLRGGGWSTGVRTDVDAKDSKAHTTQYFGDERVLATMGLKLVAGRNFRADEIVQADPQSVPDPSIVIVSKALADKMYPDGSALGKPIYIGDTKKPTIITGIVERLGVPWNAVWSDDFYENSLIQPVMLTGPFTNYLIRSKPGQLESVMKAAPAALVKANRMRVISKERGVRSFAQVRDDAYKGDKGMAILMSVVCLVLLGVTAAGIVGLTSFWVGQRRKQIGVRRALGATKRDILSYFLTENLLIGVVGVVIGALLAIGMNLWLVTQFEMARLSLVYVLVGVVALLLLGQGAVLAPALRASRVSPVEATRSV
ncbi:MULTISPECIES: FtsX-like permease family protein [unclassified Dyella]|uniref:ABC transporter permease n=1 Tax=unclassified Dyella TaxID=2634549 RepID=UPI0018EB7975|nr:MULTISPECIES: FtsX-like permease family protein [unclassified Dyella]MDR3445348.1 FtsX-like permease family protein [Dyella sp.]